MSERENYANKAVARCRIERWMNEWNKTATWWNVEKGE